MRTIIFIGLMLVSFLPVSSTSAQSAILARNELSTFYAGMFNLGSAWGRAGAVGGAALPADAVLQIQNHIQSAIDGLRAIAPCISNPDINNLRELRLRIPGLTGTAAVREIETAIRDLQVKLQNITTTNGLSLPDLFVTGIHVGAAQGWASSVQCRPAPMPGAIATVIRSHLTTASAAFASWIVCVPAFSLGSFASVPLNSMNSLDAHTHIVGIDKLITWGLALSTCSTRCSVGRSNLTTASWAGTWNNITYPGAELTLTGSGSSFTLSEVYTKEGGRFVDRSQGTCRVEGEKLKCTWTGSYEDADKTIQRKGTSEFTLKNDELIVVSIEGEPVFTWKPGRGGYSSAIRKGAVWNARYKRK